MDEYDSYCKALQKFRTCKAVFPNSHGAFGLTQDAQKRMFFCEIRSMKKKTLDICETSSRFHLNWDSVVSKKQVVLFADLGINTKGGFWMSVWITLRDIKAYQWQLPHCQHSCHFHHQTLCELLCHSQQRRHNLHYDRERWAPRHRRMQA